MTSAAVRTVELETAAMQLGLSHTVLAHTFTATDIRVVSTGGVVQHYAGIYLVLLTHIQDPD